jgi:phage shock protein E
MSWGPIFVVVLVVAALLLLKRLSFLGAQAAREHLARGALIIDVRSREEFESGHLARAVNIPLGELGERVPALVKDRSQVLLVHCLSGGRSGVARIQLKRLGYPNVFNLGSYGRARRIAV